MRQPKPPRHMVFGIYNASWTEQSLYSAGYTHNSLVWYLGVLSGDEGVVTCKMARWTTSFQLHKYLTTLDGFHLRRWTEYSAFIAECQETPHLLVCFFPLSGSDRVWHCNWWADSEPLVWYIFSILVYTHLENPQIEIFFTRWGAFKTFEGLKAITYWNLWTYRSDSLWNYIIQNRRRKPQVRNSRSGSFHALSGVACHHET
jgi:hypothetical protein